MEMDLNEALEKLKNAGLIAEDTDDYSFSDFESEMWKKIENSEFFQKESDYYDNRPVAVAKKADIDQFIREYWASMPDVDDCFLRLKNGIVDGDI